MPGSNAHICLCLDGVERSTFKLLQALSEVFRNGESGSQEHIRQLLRKIRAIGQMIDSCEHACEDWLHTSAQEGLNS